MSDQFDHERNEEEPEKLSLEEPNKIAKGTIEEPEPFPKPDEHWEEIRLDIDKTAVQEGQKESKTKKFTDKMLEDQPKELKGGAEHIEQDPKTGMNHNIEDQATGDQLKPEPGSDEPFLPESDDLGQSEITEKQEFQDEDEIPAAFRPEAGKEEAVVQSLREDLRAGREDIVEQSGGEELKTRPNLVSRLLGKNRDRLETEGLDDEEVERRLAFVNVEAGETIPAAEGSLKTTGQSEQQESVLQNEHPGDKTDIASAFEGEDLELDETEPEEIEKSDSSVFREGEETERIEPSREGLTFYKTAIDEKSGDLSSPEPADYQELREVALDEYVEPEIPEQQFSLAKFARQWWKSLSFIQKGILFVLVGLNLALVTIGIFFFIRAAVMGLRPRTAEAPAIISTSEIPYPVELRLPGGWGFRLEAATIRDGKWQPAGAEWLPGTEIQRWIAIPSSKELKAVMQAIEAGDIILLKMSNRDELEYTVQSIENIKADDLLKLS